MGSLWLNRLLLKMGPVIRHQLEAVGDEEFDQGWRAGPGLVLKVEDAKRNPKSPKGSSREPEQSLAN